ncbi:MAG: peptidoglycan DD-metalloendopeptidase family protein [Elainellaceae cyanobacterium]
MRRRIPKDCTVLIAPPGQSPVTFAIRPVPFFAVLAGMFAAPIIWIGSTIHSLHQKNHALTQENQELSETAGEVIHELEILDSQIQALQERAGMPEKPIRQSEERIQDSRGGVSVQFKTEKLFEMAKARLPKLSSHLHQQVKPALDETLEEEAARIAARPKGLPVQSSLQISSEFGLRANPFGRGYEFHNGIDFPGPIGTPIYATAPGVVQKAEWSRGYGYHVVVEHGYGYRTLYAHMSEVNTSQGDSISKGQIVGYLGNTGRSTGPHLHYSVYHNNKTVDPRSYLD